MLGYSRKVKVIFVVLCSQRWNKGESGIGSEELSYLKGLFKNRFPERRVQFQSIRCIKKGQKLK